MTESWKDIPGYVGRYQVSDLGRVRGIYKSKTTILQPETKRGATPYQRVLLCVNGIRKHYQVHRLVLLAFVGEPPDKYECLHLDHDPTNNALFNLRWGSKSENCLDRPNHIPPETKLSIEDVYLMRLLRKFGAQCSELMEEFDLSKGHVYKILRFACWS